MEGTEVSNSQNSAPTVVDVGTATVTTDVNETHRAAFEKKIRNNPAYELVPGDLVKVTLMSDGEIRIKKLV